MTARLDHLSASRDARLQPRRSSARRTVPAWALLTALAAFPGPVRAQGLVGVSFNGTLTRVNPATGVGTPLGSTGFSWEGGLARIDDVLFTNDLAGRLWRIDPWTGVATAGPQTAPALNSIRAMAADRLGTLYVIQNGGGQTGTTVPDLLYRVDERTGAATLIGSTTPFVAIQGLAFGSANELYGWDTNVGLVLLDPATAVATDVSSVGAPADIQEIAFAPNGVLYGARNQLYAIDRVSGIPSLVGSGGYSDLRGLEYVHGPRIYDNGPMVTHPGGGAGGADLSLVETTLGLTGDGVLAHYQGGHLVVEDFRTDGPWQVDAIDFFGFTQNTLPGGVGQGAHLAIYDGDPAAGGQPVAGSPLITMNLSVQSGYLTTRKFTGIYRAMPADTQSTVEEIWRVRVLFGQPLLLDSATTPSGYYSLQFAFDQFSNVPYTPFVTTLGLADTGNARQLVNGSYQPVLSNGHPQALPFVFYGTSLAPPATVLGLGGGCGPSTVLRVRGATCDGGTVVHQLSWSGGIPGFVLGFGDPNLPFAPACGCTLHAGLDILALATSRYDLVMPPGVGTGLEYRVQGVCLDFDGSAGMPCDLNLGFDLQLSDAFRVRFW